MRALFADTFFFLAILNEKDEAHEEALTFAIPVSRRLVTTDWVIVEVADAMAAPSLRPVFLEFWEGLQVPHGIEIVPSERELFRRGLDLYSRRPDKGWSLTDCISFVAMAERGLTEALTGDRHFEQAGFRALLRGS